MESSRWWQESNDDYSSHLLLLPVTGPCEAHLGSTLGHFLFSLSTVFWHKFICDYGPHCHNKQITSFSEFPTPSSCLPVAKGLSPWISPWHLKLNMLKLNCELLPQTSSFSHIVFQFVSPSSSYVFYLKTGRAYLTPSPYFPYSIKHSILLIPSSQCIVSPSPCGSVDYSVIVYTERTWVWFPVRTHTWIADSVPSWGRYGRQPTHVSLSHCYFSLSLSPSHSFSLPLSLKSINVFLDKG